ncbi:MAG: hypothetical protein ACKOZX_05755, partial [Gammaproteobacteria bacterium]
PRFGSQKVSRETLLESSDDSHLHAKRAHPFSLPSRFGRLQLARSVSGALQVVCAHACGHHMRGNAVAATGLPWCSAERWQTTVSSQKINVMHIA